jgi:hypothetical protein
MKLSVHTSAWGYGSRSRPPERHWINTTNCLPHLTFDPYPRPVHGYLLGPWNHSSVLPCVLSVFFSLAYEILAFRLGA